MKELLSITEVSLKISEGKDLKKLFNYAIKVANEAFGLENGEIYLFRKTEKDLSHFDKILHGNNTIVNNFPNSSEIITPIKSADKIIGMIKFTRHDRNSFNNTDIKNAEALASILSISIIHTELNEQVKEKLNKLELLYEISQELSKTIELEGLLDIIVKHIKKTFSFDKVAVLLTTKDGRYLKIKRASSGYGKEKIKNLKINIEIGEGITGTAAKNKETIISNDVEKDNRYINGSSNTKSEIAIPLKVKDKLLGVLDIESNIKNRFSDEDKKVLEAVANAVSLAIYNALLYEKMKSLAEKDELTGLYNYRAFRKELDKEIRRALRYKKTFSLAMFDIDFFKEYNDHNGHDVGNVALRKVGQIIIKNSRNLDFPARFGGEEFIVILPETDKRGAYIYAERIRRIVEKEKFPGEEKQPNGKLTISGGVAEFPSDGNSAEKIIKSVDIAAYKAKNSGRNKVVIFNGGESDVDN